MPSPWTIPAETEHRPGTEYIKDVMRAKKSKTPSKLGDKCDVTSSCTGYSNAVSAQKWLEHLKELLVSTSGFISRC